MRYAPLLEIEKRVLGEEHSDTLRDLANLSWVLPNLDQWAESEVFEVPLNETMARIFG